MKLFPKDKLKIFWQEKTLRIGVRTAFAILFFALASLILSFENLPPEIPLFYSLPQGEEQLGKPLFLLILPLGCLLLGILNFFLAVFSFGRQPLSAKILIWVTALLIFSATITLVKIVFLIT